MSKTAIDLPIEIKLTVGKLGGNLEEIEESGLIQLNYYVSVFFRSIFCNDIDVNASHGKVVSPGFESWHSRK